jgi:hypothetical protein
LPTLASHQRLCGPLFAPLSVKQKGSITAPMSGRSVCRRYQKSNSRSAFLLKRNCKRFPGFGRSLAEGDLRNGKAEKAQAIVDLA